MNNLQREIELTGALKLYAEKQPILSSELCASLTVEKAIESKYHIGYWKKHNHHLIDLFMVQLLKEFLIFIPNSMNDEQVLMYSETMINEYPTWKPEDFVLCLKNGRSGKYGKLYGNFTYVNFSEWAVLYELERTEYFEFKNRKREGYDSERETPKLIQKQQDEFHKMELNNYMKKLNQGKG